MAKYVLGDEGARKFKQLLQKDLAAGSSQRYGRSPALDNAYPHPYEVRWSNSLLSTDGESGGYMIWLPDHCFYVNLSAINTTDFPQIDDGDIEPLSGGNNWYKLTPTALSTNSPWPNEFDIWVNFILSCDASLSGPTFSSLSICPEDYDEDDIRGLKFGSIHIAHIKDYRPIQSVKSAIVIGGDNKQYEADEKSIALTGDVFPNSLSSLSSEYHLHHFHDNINDLSISTIISGENPPTWMLEDYDMVIRHRGETGAQTSGYVNELYYLCLQDLVQHLSSSGGGGSSGEITPEQLSAIPSPGMFAWTPKTRTMGPGGVMVGRQWINANGTGSGKADALYSVKVTFTNGGGASVEVVSNASLGQVPTDTQTYIPIYQIQDGMIVADYRGAFVVPAYD